MPQPDDDASRPTGRHSRGGLSTNLIWIVFGAICAGGVLTCCGGGIGLYFLVNWTNTHVEVTDHVKIRSMTAEIVEITIPEQFVPQEATSLLGMNIAKYEWCPTGTCPPNDAAILTLESFSLQGNDFSLTEWDEDVREVMQSDFKDPHREDRVLDIRGQRVKIAFVSGEKKPYDPNDESAGDTDDQGRHLQKHPSTAVSPKSNPGPPDNDPQPPAASDEKTPQVFWIYGFVPGKAGRCTLTLEIPADQYDDELIMTMLKSIR